ncbi:MULTISPECIES: GAF domain-containing protein [Saccharothrix]|uniref:GAF domain-containing protein n=1 Tax=Saccharothrix TaxID=2071 RepID=UPI00093C445B|nr:GAF domain-containing protein [Saccharothrix sp. CB00851]
MATDWLLIETFGGHRREPTVIAVGSSPRNMVPLRAILGRGPFLADVLPLIARVVETGSPAEAATTTGKRRVVGHPVKTYGGRVHGVHAWVGKVNEEPPARNPTGAWHINITRHISSRSDDLLRLYGTKAENWRNEHDLAELFAYGRLQTNSDESKALALLVNATVGSEHHATWTVKRDDGVRRAAHFACRCVEAPTARGEIELIVRGITHDIGPAESVPTAPPSTPVLLAQQVVAAEATPGRWRAIVDLRTMRLLRWLDDPLPGIAWKLDTPHRPGIHRQDLVTAVGMSNALAASGRARGSLRLRAEDGEWIRVTATAALMLLDQHTTAAMVTLTMPDGDKVE